METYYIIMFFIIGTVMGSFYHLVATRLANDESIISPPSHCPKCNHYLRWYENIPLISYIIQKGKCRECNSRIPISYWIVELATGILFAVCFHSFGFTLKFIVSLVFVSSLITVIVSDIEYMIILDEVIMFSTVLIMIIYFIGNGFTKEGLMASLECFYNGVGAFLIMYAIKIMGDKLFKKESLGGGDIKLMFIFGMVLGLPISICTIFLATFIAFPIALFIPFSDKENIIPFGPFLSMAAIILLVTKWQLMDIIKFLVK